MLLVAVSLSGFFESSISWHFAAGFCCSVQLEPSMMKSSSSSRASCKLVPATGAALVSCDHTQSSIFFQTTTTTAGESLVLEKAHPRYLRPGSAVPIGPGFGIWRSCRFIGALMRSLCLLLGGLRRFVPCSIGANHCRLRHSGWECCGHGLTSRPHESASELFLNELLSLFRYPPRSGRALLNGTLPLRYCDIRFACSTPTWRLPVSGHVDRLIASHSGVGNCGGKVVRVRPVSDFGPARKRFRLNSKTPAHLAGFLTHSRPRVWKRLRQHGYSGVSMPDHSRRRCDQTFGGSAPVHDRMGSGVILMQAHVSRFACLFN